MLRVSHRLPLGVVGMALALAGCAKQVDDIAPSYVSPLAYDLYTCEQLAAEASRISAKAAEAMGVQQKKAQNDAAAVGIGLILFWPAIFFVKGNGASEAEVARLKGEMDAIEQVSIQKQCGFQFERPAPPPPPKANVTANPT
jgi:hypothetical protein